MFVAVMVPDSDSPRFGKSRPNVGPHVLNKIACALSVLRKRGPGVTYVTNATSEQIKAGLRLRAHAR